VFLSSDNIPYETSSVLLKLKPLKFILAKQQISTSESASPGALTLANKKSFFRIGHVPFSLTSPLRVIVNPHVLQYHYEIFLERQQIWHECFH
jgi:hypothetical protein